MEPSAMANTTQNSSAIGAVRIKRKCANLLDKNRDRLQVLFSAKISDANDVLDQCTSEESLVEFDVYYATTPIAPDRSYGKDFLIRLQKYVDDICKEGCGVAGEDSSYDSDYEADLPSSSSGSTTKQHQDVSRTTSDTLAAEYADYVQVDHEYTAKVEFALKLGYTEKLVQAALQKLGPSPTQNELLAELIKLGAQKGSSCDNSPTEQDITPDISSRIESIGSSLRQIVIDGSNVAMSHGNKEVFSCRGIKICVDWFKARGHRDITVFVPKWRKESPRLDNPIQDQEILAELEKERLLVFTPSRLVNGKRMVCYDDRYILKLAAEVDGIVVSNDNYRDLSQESPEFRKVVEERILMYSFVNDRFMPPDDPLGRSGPTLDNFLRCQPRKTDPPPPPCPYGKKCTYGNKCKYNHPERGPFPHKSVTERLSEHAQRHLQARGQDSESRKLPLGRTTSNIPAPKEAPQHPIVSKSRSVDNVGSANFLENTHKKLQRCLINPNMRGGVRFMPPAGIQAPPSAGYMYPNAMSASHVNVTRIASAPDSCRWSPQTASNLNSRSSEPQLNVCPGPAQWNASLQEDARRRMHYHLTHLFPEDQVSHVMSLYPEETNPQKICAEILALFVNQN